MLNSIYKGLSGMLSFSKGLDTISSNVGNLNTNAYKKSDLGFSALISENGRNLEGARANDPQINLAQGSFKETDSATDVALNGSGFFVVKQDGKVFLTRDGQFAFDKDGVLRHQNNAQVMANVDGRLTPISLSKYQDVSFTPTQKVDLKGNLSTGSERHLINDVIVIDNSGKQRHLSLTIVNNGSNETGEWLVEVYEGDYKLAGPEAIRFNGNGTPTEGFNTISLALTADNGSTSKVVLNFGDPNAYSQVTSFSAGSKSTAEFDKHDGNEAGVLSKISINASGAFEFEYSNGEERTGPQLAITNIVSSQQLIRQSNNLYQLDSTQDLTLVDPNAIGAMVEGGKLELSNVELSQEFSEMIIVQRGYQASSQVMTTTNEMLQQLMEATK